MNRARVLFATVAILLMAGATVPTVLADHDYGHRYMAYGRITDSNGDPAQNMLVRVMIEGRDARGTTPFGDPYLTVPTDCNGVYYTLKERAQYNPQLGWGNSLDWTEVDTKIHIHSFQYAPRANYHVSVLDDNGTVLFTNSWRADVDRQRDHRDIRLDFETAPQPECDGIADWSSTYIVMGTIQTDQDTEGGAPRHDVMSNPGAGRYENITVTITTPDGEETLEVPTDQVGQYFAVFEDIEIDGDSVVTIDYEGNTASAPADTSDRSTGLSLFVQEETSAINPTILLAVLGVVVVAGLGFWGYSAVRDKAEMAKIRESTGRKRANK